MRALFALNISAARLRGSQAQPLVRPLSYGARLVGRQTTVECQQRFVPHCALISRAPVVRVAGMLLES